MEETKKELTVEEMYDVVDDYCDHQVDCAYCVIDDICAERYIGDLNSDPDKLKKAYDKVMSLQEPTIPTFEADEVEQEDTKEDVVNHPSHYTHGGMECIDEMILIFGKESVMHFCVCNAWKYRKRAMYKNGEEDMKKSDWYMNKYKELSELVIANGKA